MLLLYLIFAIFIGMLFHGIHRKVIARIQTRPGPPVWQEFLHVLKFSFKQTWIPQTASQTLFVAIVVVGIAIWTGALYILSTGGSLLIIFGIYLLHKITEHGLGLSSGSPYGKFGAIRSVISAASEIPLIASIGVIYFLTGSLMISDITAYQATNGILLISAFPVAIAMYVIVLSKVPYSPFGIITAKEIISGNKTEHFGVWRAGLETGFALKTFVLLATFVTIFFGSMPLWLMIIVMLVVLMTMSFVCALTPMLSPYDAVTIQIMVIGIVLVYVAVLGVLA
ncbi:NADH-ubiquinone oxidoreductase [Methanoplanus sp. FWC-SCC4]|uniref:NADH-ubiquinone oxidoreductase n=1 Tax=Methanochimaera problematica TaxID=2609417 RepID=A0AA97I450_9EURY|nr:NADH-quinone oxidoreductase subunit H [Methanoplanus sp. FWC-SCC4]WOF15946.1 NADH-ubiquinone oxidoreductase [Methanoplanus sp. FWC-SCC4]